MTIFNPCKKCIVRACCTSLCEPYGVWVTRYDRYPLKLVGWIVDLIKEKNYLLLSLIAAEVVVIIGLITEMAK